MFDTFKIDENTKLIGHYQLFDEDSTYKNFNFYITDPIEIRKAISKLFVGDEVGYTNQVKSFQIIIVQNNKILKTWIINPDFKCATYNNHSYKFDAAIFKKLGELYPFYFRIEKKPFKTNKEFTYYLTKLKDDSNYLFNYRPEFKYDGSFEIEFRKTKLFSNTDRIRNYLKPIIEKITPKNSYNIYYLLSAKTLSEHNKFTMTILGSKYLFNNLHLFNGKKQNWVDNIGDAWFFFKQE